MEVKEKVKLVVFNNNAWKEIKENIQEIKSFLSGEQGDNEKLGYLMHISSKLVLSEILINADVYRKYDEVEYSENDFIMIMIDSMTQKFPDIYDHSKTSKYIEDMRQIIWGHIKRYSKKLIKILNKMSEEQYNEQNIENNITNEDIIIFKECMTVVMVECILRNIEYFLLENNFSENSLKRNK